ncbi:MAG: hypothetical protein HC769_28740 [Cyanobacteria bacterium CRU_2_1]|nr:hypothetical protein [Cyanobacteria bacterium CRU_2_1]
MLTASLLPRADSLLNTLNQQIDGLLTDQLQPVPGWVNPKSALQQPQQPNSTLYDPVAVRAFYVSLIQPQDVSLVARLNHRLLFDLKSDLRLDLELTRIFQWGKVLRTQQLKPNFSTYICH